MSSVTAVVVTEMKIHVRLRETTHAVEALRLHTTLADVAGRLSAAEEEWLML